MTIQHIFLPMVYTNCYLLVDEKTAQAAVIDPGTPDPSIWKAIQNGGYTLCAIFLTHGHYDHTGGVKALRRDFPDVPVYLHAGDMEMKDDIFPLSGIGEATLWKEGDSIAVGSLQVDVLHTPGHSMGSVVLRCEDALFTGDTLFARSMGRIDFPGGSYDLMMHSLARLYHLEGDFRVFPGHDSCSTLNRERSFNPYLQEALQYVAEEEENIKKQAET